MQRHDVVVLGHGIAGGFLARHLRLALGEQISVLVLESATRLTDYKVGESTVELAANYMVRRLKLGTYLYQHQLPKNGLRCFFDSPGKDLPLTEMSEMGSDRFPFHPGFQLERASLERDLVTMNRSAGVRVELGATVVDLTVDPAGDHSIVYRQRGELHTVRARWIVDASGRRQMLLKKLGVPVHRETRLNTGSAWARYRGVPGLDAVEGEAWKGRVRHTARHLSTNHMMYDGYWIWFIPLAGDLMSVGVVYDKDRIPDRPVTRELFEEFLRRHRSTRDLMETAELEDFQAYAHLPYWAERYFSKDRWAVTGFAGAFVDPLYSPGSDFIATANEFIVQLVRKDLTGDARAVEDGADVFNAFYKHMYERTLRIYAGLYPTFGSFEVFRLKYMLDFNNYYNLVVWPFMAGKLEDPGWLRGELRFGDRVIQAQDAMASQFVALAEHLRARGEYHSGNRGMWHNVLAGVVRLQERLGPSMDESFRRDQVQAAYSSVFGAVVERRVGEPGLGNRKPFLSELSFPTVVLFRDIDQASVSALLERVGLRLKKELAREFPDARIASVKVSSLEGASVVPAEGELVPEEVASRATELWNARGDSLAHITL